MPYQIVPAAVRSFSFAVSAADDQPVLGARHGDVKEPAIFVARLIERRLPRRRHGRRVVGLASRPDHRFARQGQKSRLPRSGRRRHGVGQDDDRRFQSLGAVNGHDAHLVTRDFHVAFHFRARLAQPCQEALERWRFAAFIVEREIEKLVEGIVCFRTEPRQKALPAAAGAEKARVERKRSFPLGKLRELFKTRDGLREPRVSAGFADKRGAQRPAAAIKSDGKKVVILETEQRTAQDGCERKVVVRQEQRVGEHHQIHHRDMLGEEQPIGARDLDIFVLQRADDRLEQFAALAHQDKKVAVARGPAFVADDLATIDHPPDGASDAAGQFHPRRGFANVVERRVPAFDVGPFLRLRWLPDLDDSWRGVRKRQVRRKSSRV